jgi:mono/diheme cytochrome c family protein
VISCLSTKLVARALVTMAPALLGLLLLSGCENEYPQDLRYSLRTDPLVDGQLVSRDPAHLNIDPPGVFDKPAQFSFVRDDVTEDTARLIVDPAKLPSSQRTEIDRALEELFGTPRSPTVDLKKVNSDEDAQKELAGIQQSLKLDAKTLAEGSSLYRLHCLHCHGLTGNGRGPTAPWVNPHPRDYRSGIFKFASASGGNERKPRREDLLRTLHEGIEGTSMPSFGLLSEGQLDALTSYVIHLSMRGEVEFNVMKELSKEDRPEGTIPERAATWLEALAGRWKAADSNLIRPPDGAFPQGEEQMAASVKRGYNLFVLKEGGAGCISCHIDYGRQATYFYDSWGTIDRPADLTQPIRRGGRRPIDLYWRIHSGINGANMPASAQLAAEPQKIWDLVNFVQVLPYPAMRQKYGININ